jgi:hypothetical protein
MHSLTKAGQRCTIIVKDQGAGDALFRSGSILLAWISIPPQRRRSSSPPSPLSEVSPERSVSKHQIRISLRFVGRAETN